MTILNWLKLLILEQKLRLVFGKYNEYRRKSLTTGAKTAKQRLSVAEAVLAGPNVNTMTAQSNALYLRQHRQAKQKTDVPRQASQRFIQIVRIFRRAPSKRRTAVEQSDGKPVQQTGGS